MTPPLSPPAHFDLVPVRLAAYGVACAVLVGTLVVVATVIAVSEAREADPAAALTILLGGTIVGIGLAAAAAWRLLAPLGSIYRRGGFAVVSAFATIVVMLLTMPIHEFFGRSGLLGLAAVCAAGCLVLWRRIGRLTALL